MATDRELREAYATMRAAFPSWASKQDAASVRLWGGMLRDADGPALIAAIKSLAMSCEFAPTVAKIREAAGCVDPATAARRAASSEAAARHDAWVAERERRATAAARKRLRASGIDPDSIQPTDIATLVRGIGN